MVLTPLILAGGGLVTWEQTRRLDLLRAEGDDARRDTMGKPAIAIIGASANREKFANKAVRAYLRQGYDVYPVHPTEAVIEGLQVYRSVLDIPVALDRVSFYVPPAVGLRVVEEVARKGCKELWLNPGADSPELYEKACSLGLNAIMACSLVAVGADPTEM